MSKPTRLPLTPVAIVACLALLFPVVSAYGFHDAEAAHLRTGSGMTHSSMKALPETMDIRSFKQMPASAATEAAGATHSVHIPSFLGGVGVGIVATMLIVGALTDSVPLNSEKGKKSATSEPDPEEIDAADSSESAVAADGHPESLHLFRHRCGWLVAMMLIQSISSLILDSYRDLMSRHVDLAFFLTMLVGLGGNAGCQSVVLTVRRLAQGKSTKVMEQVWIGVLLACVLAPLAFLRAYGQSVSLEESVVIGLSAATICVTACCLGAGLPKLLFILKVDPAHSAVVVQVLMDITGITIVCFICYCLHHSGYLHL
eukprot:TRINITY_DN11683_c1_g1_i1.p1 TRINITY_DN11683_c1_g1~~TRINITY_DN11683_c1_g1_i1.p1  ORF type:complete len:315 (-),score=43.94 TRINITY_DN11683_c1_g1_i1:108-1052(-)